MAIFDSSAALRAELDKAMEPIKTALFSGSPMSYDKYREAVGELRGLQKAYALATPTTQTGVFGGQQSMLQQGLDNSQGQRAAQMDQLFRMGGQS